MNFLGVFLICCLLLVASDYAIKEKPLLVEDMQGGPDYIVLKTLDTDSIRIIGSVLGQSIALDYFVSQVNCFILSAVFYFVYLFLYLIHFSCFYKTTQLFSMIVIISSDFNYSANWSCITIF